MRLGEATFCAIDAETTGSTRSSDRVIEVGAVRFRLDGSKAKTWSALMNPGVPIKADAMAIHGIHPNDLADQPPPAIALATLPAFLANVDVLFAHGASFDAMFIGQELRLANLPICEAPMLDSLRIAKARLRGMVNYKLGTLATHLGVAKGKAHRALGDAITLARMMKLLLDPEETLFDLSRIAKVYSLAKAGKRKWVVEQQQLDLMLAPAVVLTTGGCECWNPDLDIEQVAPVWGREEVAAETA